MKITVVETLKQESFIDENGNPTDLISEGQYDYKIDYYKVWDDDMVLQKEFNTFEEAKEFVERNNAKIQ